MLTGHDLQQIIENFNYCFVLPMHYSPQHHYQVFENILLLTHCMVFGLRRK